MDNQKINAWNATSVQQLFRGTGTKLEWHTICVQKRFSFILVRITSLCVMIRLSFVFLLLVSILTSFFYYIPTFLFFPPSGPCGRAITPVTHEHNATACFRNRIVHYLVWSIQQGTHSSSYIFLLPSPHAGWGTNGGMIKRRKESRKKGSEG